MFSTIPPTGIQLNWSFIFNQGHATTSNFESALSNLVGGKTYLTNSGKSALYLILKAASMLHPEKQEVIIPDYTCWSVPSAVVKAGLKVRPIDIDQNNLGLSPNILQQAINSNTLAVVHTHLFGIPGSIDIIEEICKKNNIFLIDDAAQGLGAKLKNRMLGSFGDAGIFSFGRGKTITTLHGGASVVRNEKLKNYVNEIYENEFQVPHNSDISVKLQLAAYKILFNRHLYWIPDSIPFLKLGETIYEPEFSISCLGANLATRGEPMFKNLNKFNLARNDCAAIYFEKLNHIQNVIPPICPTNAEPAFIRMPIMLKDCNIRRYLLLKGHNLGISAMYPGTICSIPQLKPHLAENISICPDASKIAETLITLPTHYCITNSDIQKIVDIIKSYKSKL